MAVNGIFAPSAYPYYLAIYCIIMRRCYHRCDYVERERERERERKRKKRKRRWARKKERGASVSLFRI